MCVCIFIHFPVGSQLEHRAPFGVSVITYTIRHTVGLLWTSDQPVAKPLPTQDNTTYKQKETNIHVPSGIRTRDPSNQAAADLRLRPRGHWDRHVYIYVYNIFDAVYTRKLYHDCSVALQFLYILACPCCLGNRAP
jgi:hypothetical protein